MGFIKWIGRMLLWLILFPIGIWRSIRHGNKKTEKRIIDAMEKANRKTTPPS